MMKHINLGSLWHSIVLFSKVPSRHQNVRGRVSISLYPYPNLTGVVYVPNSSRSCLGRKYEKYWRNCSIFSWRQTQPVDQRLSKVLRPYPLTRSKRVISINLLPIYGEPQQVALSNFQTRRRGNFFLPT